MMIINKQYKESTMKNKICKTVLSCTLAALVLSGCSFNPSTLPVVGKFFDKSSGEQQEEVVEEQPVTQEPNLTVNVGEVIDYDNLCSFVQSLTGDTPTQLIANSEEEFSVQSITVLEGIHTVDIIYNVADDATERTTSFIYEGVVSDAATEASSEEVVEETPAPEYLINLSSESVTIASTDLASANTDMVYLLSDTGALDMYKQSLVGGTKPIINTTEMTYEEAKTHSGEPGLYEAVLASDVFYVDSESYPKMYVVDIYSTDAAEKLEFIYIPSDTSVPEDESTEETSEASDESAEDTSAGETTSQTSTWANTTDGENLITMITESGEYLISWNVPMFTLAAEGPTGDNPDAAASETSDGETQEVITSVVEENYQSKHPELYRWPASEYAYSRWDWRITDGTSFTSTITLPDGSIIPDAQQNQENGYSLDFTNQNGSNQTNSSNPSGTGTPTQNNQVNTDEASVSLALDDETFTVKGYSSEYFKVLPDESTDDKAVIKFNSSEYYVQVIDTKDWLIYTKKSYIDSDEIGSEYTISETSTGTTADGTTYHNYSIAYTDSSGKEISAPYISMIEGDTHTLIVYNPNSIEYEFSEVLHKIMKYCITKET